MSDRILRAALGAVLLISTLSSCSEQISGSLGCPTLCTDESATLRDTILAGAVVLDSSFLGFPQLGEDRDITLLNQGDTADVRLIARFDSLPLRYQIIGATSDSLIRRVDSATFIFVVDTVATKVKTPITIEAFDVDTTASDTSRAALVPLFRDSRKIGSQTYLPEGVKDTLRLTLSNAAIFGKIRDTLRLRIGLRISGLGSTKLRVVGNTFVPRLRFRVSADTTVKPDSVFPNSATPAGDPLLNSALRFYPLVAKGALGPPPPGRFVIGGLSGARAYLRFDIPSAVLDSVTVIRASLLLTQVPARSTGNVTDSVTVYTHPVLASPNVTDVFTAATFLGSQTIYGVDTVRFSPGGSGVRSIEIVNLLRIWQALGTTNAPRALVLRTPLEGGTAAELDFVSIEGPAAQRPRLRLTFVPRRGFGIP